MTKTCGSLYNNKQRRCRMKRVVQKAVIICVLATLLGSVITTYLEDYQMELLMPLRNLLLLGSPHRYIENDIPVTQYPHTQGVNPVHVAQTVQQLVLKTLGEEGPISSTERETICGVANYFIEHAESRSYGNVEFYVWVYDFNWPTYGIPAPWVSGMAQGHAIETLLACYKLSKDERYLQAARLAANAMVILIEHGGVAVEIVAEHPVSPTNGPLWFEEYASPAISPPYVLNGHIFALRGLWYLCQEDREYQFLFERGVYALEVLLPRFDAGIWSLYDLRGTPALRRYHKLHVKQLFDMYAWTNKPIFKQYAQKFRLQLYFPFTAFYKLIVGPSRFLVLLFLTNAIVLGIILAIISCFIPSLRGGRHNGRQSGD